MSSSSSLDTASGFSEMDSATGDMIGGIDQERTDINDVEQLIKTQNAEAKRFQLGILKSQKNMKKWTKTQVDTVSAIREAEVEAKRYELERLQAEYEADLANKETEFESELRDIQTECGELRVKIQQLELELSEVKESRKRDLLTVRSQIESSLKEMEASSMSHDNQIVQLKAVLDDLRQKHQNDIDHALLESQSTEEITDSQISQIVDSINRLQRESRHSDESYGMKMNESQSTIEMLKGEISSSQDRTRLLCDEIQVAQQKLASLQQDLYKCEEQSRMLKEQIIFADEQKKIMKNELNKLDSALWNTKKSTIMTQDRF
ncbi:hypothetical protein TVAG_452630 [Trichomonas vaginalis G3]|uniref:Uncharacterized protein n=1 Tax=Trichomonas vaginalis (strain ATCC PRA-98 / G3) TaxID=412133 RepID=A2DJY5_TRIV3|nr:hypothetical protein TVAGG3_0290810 [Trichomonas vaginalis G3]EAY19349.1 hypothetical protein TVAG_452630 [Trichomonas vaginalis G3]KAI5527256.1 hypothetical protein TVAGG3_0290810 [Trichomonas vaginalis G3]|eukprot:XP_001580335.1 hypothetical protein [Trichomonas vaginalis G3]